MNILLLGSGGREHALAWKMSQSPLVKKIYVLPGNAGMSETPKVCCVEEANFNKHFLASLAHQYAINLIVVGPEKPLSEGVVEALDSEGFKVFGPTSSAAQLESSKVFAKNFMQQHSIPTAPFHVFEDYDLAWQKLQTWDYQKGIVLKADGLASGKGVVVTHEKNVAEKTLFDFMKNPQCSVKTTKILLEEKLLGKEVSAFALCDGEHFAPLGYICDYKRLRDGDQGPNTGGMGGYSPQNWPSNSCKKFVNDHIFSTVLQGMKKQGSPFRGILYAGLMIDQEKVSVLEFNVRFGDPETQILLPLIETDLVPYFQKVASHASLATLPPIRLQKKVAIHVVMTSEGYPAIDETPMRLGQVIQIPTHTEKDSLLFFAGVKRNSDGNLVNTGGRVLGVTALGDSFEIARKNAYQLLQKIHFSGAYWRKDIAQ